MNTKFTLKLCYKLLDIPTPLYFNCGELCEGKCCKGDKNIGMLLFPGEEALIDEGMEVYETEHGKIAVCNGKCNRAKRPLACRMYPFFPMVKNSINGKKYIAVEYDIRAIECPIKYNYHKINRRFLRRLEKVGYILLKNGGISEFYCSLSDDLEGIKNLRELIYGN